MILGLIPKERVKQTLENAENTPYANHDWWQKYCYNIHNIETHPKLNGLTLYTVRKGMLTGILR